MGQGQTLANIGPGWVRRVMDRAFRQGILVPRFGGLALAWDDLRFPFSGSRFDSPSSDIIYNTTDCSLEFQTSARYPADVVSFNVQMQHDKYLNSAVEPHLHWIQEEDHIPNFLLAIRWYKNGAQVPSFTLAIPTTHLFTYVSGEIAQITEFPLITAPADETVSSIMDIKLYRDFTNVSTLFTGADPYTIDVQTKEFDLHYQKDSLGSVTDFTKDAV